MVVSDLLQALLGGVIIGSAAILLMLFNGRIAGISGILSGVLKPQKGDTLWRALFIIGLIVSGVVWHFGMGSEVDLGTTTWPVIVIGGLLVGAGTYIGSGCTSGHGICGMGRLSIRSIIASMVFMAVGVVAAVLFH